MVMTLEMEKQATVEGLSGFTKGKKSTKFRNNVFYSFALVSMFLNGFYTSEILPCVSLMCVAVLYIKKNFFVKNE